MKNSIATAARTSPRKNWSSSTRVTLTAMAMGEAAGMAAAMAVGAKKGPQEIGGVKVREALSAMGAGPFTTG